MNSFDEVGSNISSCDINTMFMKNESYVQFKVDFLNHPL